MTVADSLFLNVDLNDSIFEKKMDEIFNDEWYEGVHTAITVGLLSDTYAGLSKTEIIDRVATFNVVRTLQESVLNDLLSHLPKTLDWNDVDYADAKLDIGILAESCALCDSFERFTLNICNANITELTEHFTAWKKELLKTNPSLKISLRKNKNSCSITFKRSE